MLSDEENCSALNLEKLALKKLPNNNVFIYIKEFLDLILQDKSFWDRNNRKNFVFKDGTTVQYLSLDTSIEKLGRKYANFKTEWHKLRDQVKNGSGLSPKNHDGTITLIP